MVFKIKKIENLIDICQYNIIKSATYLIIKEKTDILSIFYI